MEIDEERYADKSEGRYLQRDTDKRERDRKRYVQKFWQLRSSFFRQLGLSGSGPPWKCKNAVDDETSLGDSHKWITAMKYKSETCCNRWVRSTLLSLRTIHSKQCCQKISATSRMKKFLGTPRIEPGAAGWEARMLPLCFAVHYPHPCFYGGDNKTIEALGSCQGWRLKCIRPLLYRTHVLIPCRPTYKPKEFLSLLFRPDITPGGTAKVTFYF